MARATPGRLAPRILLQADMEGHSRYMASRTSKPSAALERIEVARRLEVSLRRFKFELLSWKGDGGVYSAAPQASGSLGFAVDAARALAGAFDEWRAERKERETLRMRVSLHWAPDLYIFAEPGYWSSDHLNLFVKYEREIGLSSTIAATDGFFSHLSDSEQREFAIARQCVLGVNPGGPLVSKVHYLPLSGDVALNRGGGGGFFEWLSLVDEIPFDPHDRELGPSSFVRGAVGDAAFLFAAPLPDSPVTVDLQYVDHQPRLTLDPAIETRWVELQQEEVKRCQDQLQQDGRKVSPYRLIRPLSDIPVATLEWRLESWSRARSFHELLLQDHDLRRHLASQALAIHEEGVTFPGIACCHFVVRTTAKEGPGVLLCQRQIKGPEGMYDAGRWSISFEEQMQPGETVNDCVQRGLREELLGTGAVGVEAGVLAGILEKRLLNLAFIIMVDVPLGVAEISELWKAAVDKDEHRQLATLPLNREVLGHLGAGAELSKKVRGLMAPSNTDVLVATERWDLHPTAIARAAVALWAQETRAGRSV